MCLFSSNCKWNTLDILTVHLLDVCKRFKMEAALRSYLQQKTGIIFFFFLFSALSFLFWFVFTQEIYTHSAVWRWKKMLYSSTGRAKCKCCVLCLSVGHQWKPRAKLPGQPLAVKLNKSSTCPAGIVDIGSSDKSTADSWYRASSDALERAAVTLNYSVDRLWWDDTSSLVPARGLAEASPRGLELWAIAQCLTAPSPCKVWHVLKLAHHS